MDDNRQSENSKLPSWRVCAYRFKYAILLFAVSALLSMASGCQRLQIGNRQGNGSGLSKLARKLTASNDRDWRPDLAVLPWAEANGNLITVRNIRNTQYANADHYMVNHYDRTFDVRAIEKADYIVCPFNSAAALAHTMISFGLNDGTHICVSAEVRKEKTEDYSAVQGLGRKFELMYVVADEKDLIGSRTKHRDINVYVYPTVATPEQSQALFVDVMERVNQLARKPEFYNTLTNNCTTNIKSHVNRLAGNKIKYDWRVLLPSYSAKYAYDLGLLDNSIPFEDLQSLSLVNDLSNEHLETADYSTRIRGRRSLISRLAERNGTGETVSSPDVRLR